MLRPGVAEEVGDRLAGAVFVDAFYPRHGESALDLLPDPFRERFRQLADDEGDGWRLPASDALLDVWGLVEPDDRSWVRDRLTDWSISCFESPVQAPTGAIADLPRWYVQGTKDCPSRVVFGSMARRAAEDGCAIVDAPSGHDVMIEAPDLLAAVVVESLGGGRTERHPTREEIPR
jgi:pimeloyl-ACP methyl ester carboxylesterase